MAKKNSSYIFLIIFASALTIVLGFYFYYSPYFEIFSNWVLDNLLLYSLFLFLIKVVGLLWPPLPGGLFTFASVTVLGWQLAFAIDFLGNIVGASLAWFVGRKYGSKLIGKIFSEQTAARAQRIKIKRQHEFEGILVFSLASGVVMVEIANYILGILKVRYKNFFLANTLAHVIRNAPIFYVFDSALSGGDFVINLVIVVVALLLLLVFWKRYITIDEHSSGSTDEEGKW